MFGKFEMFGKLESKLHTSISSTPWAKSFCPLQGVLLNEYTHKAVVLTP